MVGSYDITWNATDVAFWSMFECSLACIIACLPALNHLIVKFLKKFTRSNTKSADSKPPPNNLGTIRLPMQQPEAYQRSVISSGYGRFLKHWASASRTGSESSGEAQARWGSRSGSWTASSSNPSTNNSSVMETTVYIVDDMPSDIEEEGEDLNDMHTTGLGSTSIHQCDPTGHIPSNPKETDASGNV
ncbi:hypothetical protein TWF281_000597 [Arthrobotrys megalospora]